MSKPPERTHPLARAPLVDRANRFLAKAWDKGWLPPPSLDPDDLWRSAAKGCGEKAALAERSGRSAEDIADFRQRLEVLTRAIETEADLNPLGRAMAWGQLVRVIRNRLRFGMLWAERPDMPRTTIAPPIIVLGHMRSGTTRIHKLFAADPTHSATRYCDAAHPVPSQPDLRMAKTAIDLALMRRVNPWLDTIHPMAAGEVEEELSLIANALNHSIYESQWRVPGFTAFAEASDPAPVYREFDRMLRTDAAHRGIAELPRVLKVPAFTEDAATLLAQFPDARVVLSERDLEQVGRSAVSLVANQMTIQSDSADLEWIETEWRRKIALREKRMAAALANWSGPVARLDFDELNADWESAIAKAYAALDLILTPDARTAMHRAMQASARTDHARHAKQLERFDT